MKTKEGNARIDKGIRRGAPVQIIFDGKPVKAYKGETIASALLSAGYFVSRTVDSMPMGVYCNMGICYSCVMKVNGVDSVRICQTKVSDGCLVESQHIKKGQ